MEKMELMQKQFQMHQLLQDQSAHKDHKVKKVPMAHQDHLAVRGLPVQQVLRELLDRQEVVPQVHKVLQVPTELMELMEPTELRAQKAKQVQQELQVLAEKQER